VVIEDIRQQRLQDLLRDRYKTRAALAEATGVAPSYVSRLLSKGKNRKRLKEDLARKMEIAAGLPPLSLDRDDNNTQAAAAPSWPFSFARVRFDRLDPRDREKIDQAITIMLSLCEGRLERATKRRAA
jgi:transcriptional regulator with XRE-family HTH domain